MPDSDPVRIFRKLAQANRLANARLHAALATLPPGAYDAARPSFFGSIRATVNHSLLVDRFYINALLGGRLPRPTLDEARACPDLATLAGWQAAEDARLLAHVQSLTPASLT
ncbi:DinB family protein, partial [Rhodopseudomonas palustris]